MSDLLEKKTEIEHIVEVTNKLKEEGNELFKNKLFYKALETYDKAINNIGKSFGVLYYLFQYTNMIK